ncbi:MAG: hypothetical protein IPG61_19280 [bacterium]|nr:hypothetical protein [bacterium]
MTAEENIIFEKLERALARNVVEADEIFAFMEEATAAPRSTRFCLEVCRAFRFVPDAEGLTAIWFIKAMRSAEDWRDQYCAVIFAREDLQDMDVAMEVYESKPWLGALGFDLEHSFVARCTHPDSMVLMSPDGVCDNTSLEADSSRHPSLEGGVIPTPFVDGRLQRHCFLKPGTYSGSFVAGGGSITLIGIAGSDQTIVELGDGDSVFQSSFSMSLHGLTIRRVRGDGAKIPAVAWRELASIEIADCKISNPDGTAVGSVGEIGESVRIKRCLIRDSRRGVDVRAMHVSIEDTQFDGIAEDAIVMRIDERWPRGHCSFRAERSADP